MNNEKVKDTMDELIQSHIINYRTYNHVNVIFHDNNLEYIMKFLHKALSYLLRSVKCFHIVTMPVVNVNDIHKYFPKLYMLEFILSLFLRKSNHLHPGYSSEIF